MNELQTLAEIVAAQVNACQDADLLDLIRSILILEGGGRV